MAVVFRRLKAKCLAVKNETYSICPLKNLLLGGKRMGAIPNKNDALKWLTFLREDSGNDFYGKVRIIREGLANDLSSLSEIGTSEDELARLEETYQSKVIGQYIKCLTEGTSDYARVLHRLYFFCSMHGLSLHNMGYSEDYLRKLEIGCCEFTVRKSLKSLREGSVTYANHLNCLRKGVKDAGFSLADFDIAESGLEELRLKCCKIAAHRCIGLLRGESTTFIYEGVELLEKLRHEIEVGGLTLSDVGTSEEELEGFRIGYYKTATQKWLRQLREDGEDYDLTGYEVTELLKKLYHEIKVRGLTLSDAGTSQGELDGFQKKTT